MAPESQLISVRGLRKSFGSFTLDVSALDISEGEFLTIVGPSGAGKTTLFNLVGGFLRADSGSIKIAGLPVESQAGRSRLIRTVFQDLALFPHLSVIKQLKLAAHLGGLTKREAFITAEDWISRLRLEEKRNEKPGALSGGQKQRLALGRALIGKPKILLLDEPMTALDNNLRSELWEGIDDLIEERGNLSLLVITHDPDLALSRSNRLLVLENGNCVQIGTPQEVYSRPVSASVARLLGPANVLPWGDDKIMIRPERVDVDSSLIRTRDFTAKGRLNRKTYHGSTMQVAITWEDREVVARLPLSSDKLAVDSDVVFGWNRDDAHVFREEDNNVESN